MTGPRLDHSDWVCEDECHEAGHGCRHQMVPCAQLPGGVSVLQPGLDGLVKQEVRSPGAARRHYIWCDSPVQAPHTLGPHDRCHGVTYRSVLCPPLDPVIHGKPKTHTLITVWQPWSHLILSRSSGCRRRVETTPPDIPAIMCRTCSPRFITPGGRLLLLILDHQSLTPTLTNSLWGLFITEKLLQISS